MYSRITYTFEVSIELAEVRDDTNNVLLTTRDSGLPSTTPDLPNTRASGPSTPTSIDVDARFPSTQSEGCRFQIPSPHTPTATPAGDKPTPRLPGTTGARGLSPQTVPGPTSDPLENVLFPAPSPRMMDVHRFQGPTASPGANMGGGFENVSPQGKLMDVPYYGCGRGDTIPLNPNCTSRMTDNPKVPHFDPISSLAQVSQQLPNSVANSLNGQGSQGPPMMNFGSPSMHMMDMGESHGMSDMDQGSGPRMVMPMQSHAAGFHSNSPMGPIRSISRKPPGAFSNHMPMPRMKRRPPGLNPYNGANVRVKPNAPNSIQYLPAKSQVGQAPRPRGPPSLDYLTRLATPMNVMDSEMQSQNMQKFPSRGPNNGPMQGGAIPPPMGHMHNSMPQDGNMAPMNMGTPIMGNGAGPMGPMGGSMRMPPGGMMPMMRRGPMRPPMGMRMPQMKFNGPPDGPRVPDSMFNPGAINYKDFV